MAPYLVDLSPILEQPGESFAVTAPFEVGEIVVGDETFVAHGPAVVRLDVANVGEGVLVRGSIGAAVRAVCARCLCEFDTEIEGTVEILFVSEHDAGDGDEDVQLIPPDGVVDLGTNLAAALVIEAPFAPVHDPECAGLCHECGADLNEGECSCVHEVGGKHPFSALKDLLPPEES